MKKRFLDFPVELKALDESKGTFKGYGSVFGVIDSYKEVVDKGAFSESLKTKRPALLWQHNRNAPIGIYTSVKEDDHGLLLEGELNLETQQGREAYALLKQGALDGLSIGFMPLVEEVDKQSGIIHIKKLRLMEVSIVTFPANEDATVDSVKSAPDTIRDFERFLRDGGYSQKDAEYIAANGYRAHEARRDGGDLAAVGTGLERLLQQLRKSLPNDIGENRSPS